jgi:hypothetical protein
MRRFIQGVSAISVALWLSGCSALVKPGPALTVNVTGAFSTIQANSAPVQLNAVITNGENGVKWTLSIGGSECSPDCGTLVAASKLSSNLVATYTPPQTPPTNQVATITATSVHDRRVKFAFNFTILPTTVVSVDPKFTSVIIGGPSIAVTATVTNDPANAGVTWTLTAGGADCSPACGKLTVSVNNPLVANYQPPPALPSGAAANPTITATSVTNTNASDGFSFTINGTSALLKGSYAFLLRGFDVAGSPMVMAGSVTSDGNGNITAGEFDVDNDGGITHAPSPLTGTYTVTGTNGIFRGAIDITSFKFPNSTSDIILKFALSADGTNGSVVELDGVGYRNSGTIQLQDSAAISAAPSGSFAFGLDSDAPIGGRTVEVGQLVFGAGGSVSGLVDESKAADASPRYAAAPIDSGTVGSPDSSGRGTLSITVAGTTSQYAYYVVNAKQLNLIQTDPSPTLGTAQGGVARQQQSLTATSIFGNSVLQWTGMDAVPGTQDIGPSVLIGVMNVAPGNQNGSFFNLTFDSNDLGIILANHPATGFVSTFDPATGRGHIHVAGGFQTGFVNEATFYLYDQGAGFIIDSDLSTPDGTPPDQTSTNNAFSGTFVAQAKGPFTMQDFSGVLILRSGASAIPLIPNITAGLEVVLDTNQGKDFLNGLGDLTSSDSQVGNAPDIEFTGISLIPNGTSKTGRGFAQFPAGFFGDFSSSNLRNAVFYMIAPNQFVLIGRDPGINSGVSFFTPE